MSFYHDIKNEDLISVWKPLLDTGKYMINSKDGKIWRKAEFKAERDGLITLDPDKKWIFTNNPHDRYCEWAHDISDLLHFIPTSCLSCWKVVVRPQKLTQLFDLYDLQLRMVEEDPKCYCKCGLEERPYIFGNYGCYFYNPSENAALDRLDEVREQVSKIDPDISVFCKKYCTEFERKYGPSIYYRQPKVATYWEKLIAEKCHKIPFIWKQTDDIRKRIMREWIKFAWDRGDHDIYVYTDGQPLVPPVCTYEREEK